MTLREKTGCQQTNVKPQRGRPGIDGGFDSSHHPVVGTFDRFNGLPSNILLTFGWGIEQKLSAQFKCPAYAQPPAPPRPSSSLHVTLGALQYELFNDWLWKTGTLTYNKSLLTDVNKYQCLTNDLSKTKTKPTNELPTTNNRWIEIDQCRMTNLTRILQPIPLRLYWPITFNRPHW